MKVFYVFLLVLGYGVVHSNGRAREHHAPPIKTFRTKPWDQFFLVQQWPASFCSVTTTPCPSIPPYFTVRSLRAQLKNGQSVYCVGKTFKISKVLYVSQIQKYPCMLLLSSFFIYIYSLAFINIYIYIYLQINPNTKLDKTKFWPNLFRQNQNKIFWRHEYDKHASCISPFQNDRDKYFSSTLKLAMDSKIIGNVTTMLLKAGSIYLYRIKPIFVSTFSRDFHFGP